MRQLAFGMCRTSPRMMYWITSIVLKDLKLGFAAATVLDALHPVRALSASVLRLKNPLTRSSVTSAMNGAMLLGLIADRKPVVRP